MFGLLKLLAYGLLGYAIYEFIRGMSGAGTGEDGGGARRLGGRRGGARLREESRRGNLTGPGRGTEVTTEDESGESVRRTVGRGVVS
jgi:hypothetical protein